MNERVTPMLLINVLLVLITAYWLAKNDADADLWGHIKYGEDLLRSWSVPATDPYSYTAGELPWVNHEVAAEVVLALLHWAGNWAIVLWKLCMGLFAVGAAAYISRDQKRGPLVWLLLASLILGLLPYGWAPRPQVFSYTFYSLLMLILAAGELRPRVLWWGVPLLAAWINFHGGFLFGLGVFGIYLWTKIAVEVKQYGFANRRLLATWCLIGLAALGSTLINPYGLGMYEGLVRELGIQRTQVAEWSAVNWRNTDWMPLKYLMLLTIFGVLYSRKPIPIYQLVLLIVVLVESQLHIRHMVFLALSVLAWMPGHVQDAFDRLGERFGLTGLVPAPVRDDCPRWVVMTTGVAALVLCVAVATRFTAIKVDRQQWPVDAFAYISRHQLEGKMVVPFNWAQYAIYAFYPRIRVSFDGRYGTVYDNDILDMNFDLCFPEDPKLRFRSPESPPFDPTRVLDYLDPNLVLIHVGKGVGYPQAGEVMEDAPGWTLLYKDRIARIYGRSELYADARLPTFIPEEARIENHTALEGWLAFPAVP